MTEILSLWHFPLDQVNLSEAKNIRERQPRCSISLGTDFSAMTIYNYGAYAPSPPNELGDTAALTSMFSDMSAATPIGGLAFIEQINFPISASAFSVPDQCDIVGSGVGGFATGAPGFYHFTIDYSAGSTFLSCSGNYTSGGKYFRDLAFTGTQLGGNPEATCILAASENCRAINCTFTDIPVAFKATGSGCALEQCTIYWTVFDGTTAVIISGADCGVFGPGEIFQAPRPGGPRRCTGVSIVGAENTVIADIHLSEWTTGIDFSQAFGAEGTVIRNCEIQSWQNALNIQLPVKSGSADPPTSGIKVIGCLLAKTAASTDGMPAVNIDPQLGTLNTNDQLSDITLLDCTVINPALSNTAAQHGLQILGGTNIKIIGGTYSNNSSAGGAGIAIMGPCGDVQIIGANLQPSYPWAGTIVGDHLNYQQYGLLVASNPAATSTVYVADCNLTGYLPSMGQNAVSVTVSPASGLFIYNCAGYNDQGTLLNGGAAPTMPTHAATCTTPYFGPSVIIFSSTSTVTVNVFGQNIMENFGIVFLPSPYDDFHFVGTPPTMFSWIGK